MGEVNVKILFFAKAREIIGKSEEFLSLTPGKLTGKELTELILKNFSLLEPLAPSIVLAVDQEYVQPADLVTITSSTEIAFIPPLSGG